jgi:hypothetical protein
MSEKIQPSHTERDAYVYIPQSTMVTPTLGNER